jgi:hypothetical protein
LVGEVLIPSTQRVPVKLPYEALAWFDRQQPDAAPQTVAPAPCGPNEVGPNCMEQQLTPPPPTVTPVTTTPETSGWVKPVAVAGGVAAALALGTWAVIKYA